MSFILAGWMWGGLVWAGPREAVVAEAKAPLESKEAAFAAEQARIVAEQKAAQARLDAQRKQLDSAAQALQAEAAREYAALKPLIEMDVSFEMLSVLEAFVKKYSGAKVRVDDLEQAVVVPGLAKVQAKLGGASSGGTNSVGMKFVAIAAGSFKMGSPSSEKDRRSDERQHRVRLSKPFLMGMTEVTQGQWRAVMGNNPSHFSSCGADCPVETVSWFDAVKFANALSKKEGLRAAYRISGKTVRWDKSANGYRLPTEAEWEYAARGGQSHLYSGSSTLNAVGWSYENSGHKTRKVAGKRANAWGLYDMSGNVYEWCWDWYGKYRGSGTNPIGAQSGDKRVLRGGSWNETPAYARVTDRDWDTPDLCGSILGLRLVRTNP